MNKKGLDTDFVLKLILVVVALLFLTGFTIKYQESTKSLTNQELIQAWVTQMSLPSKEVHASSYPPVTQLSEPILIKNRDDLLRTANPQIAEAMVSCWNAFGAGKANFLPKLREVPIFCFPCTTVSFSQKIKSDPNAKLEGLNAYLKSNKPVIGEENPTYLAFLTEKNPDFLKYSPANEKDQIGVNEDLYIMFVGADALGKGKIVTSVVEGAAVGGVAGAAVGSVITPVAGTLGGFLAGSVAGAGTVAYQKWATDTKPSYSILLANAAATNALCHGEYVPEEKKVVPSQSSELIA